MRLIYGISKVNRFIRPFDSNILYILRSEILGSRVRDPGLRSRVQIQVPRLVLRLVLGASRPVSRILNLKYTGFKGLPIASNNLRLTGPKIGYARLLSARNTSNQSTILDLKSVITLGHTLKQPLMEP